MNYQLTTMELQKIEEQSKKVFKPLAEYEQTYPQPLKNFELDVKNLNYSHQFGLWCITPRFVRRTVRKKPEAALRPISRTFVYRGQQLYVDIFPTWVNTGTVKKPKWVDAYPGTREEIVEDILLKWATEGKGVFLDGQFSVKFTLADLSKELKDHKKSKSRKEIREALWILTMAQCTITSADGTAIKKPEAIITEMTITERGKKNETGYVRFNSYISDKIKNKDYRLYDYATCITYKSFLSRYLHKRMSYLFIQAGYSKFKAVAEGKPVNNDYGPLLSTIIRDSGMPHYDRLKDAKKKVVEALEEMKAAKTISGYKMEDIFDPANKQKKIDCQFNIFAGKGLIAEAKKSNALTPLPERS